MYLYRFIIFFSFWFCCFNSKAQFPNPSDFNTATNATSTGTLPIGTPDLHWSASMTGINGTYLTAVTVGSLAPAAWVISPYVNAAWITYPHTCTPNNWPDHSCNGAVDVYYKLIVDLPTSNCAGTSVSTPSAYCLTFDYFSDNWVNGIYVNGVLSYTNYIANPGGSLGFIAANKKTVNLCNNWAPGSNTVIVFTSSGSGWGGFLAQANHTVSTNYSNILTASVSVTNASCFNGLGSASVAAGGVSGPYTYTWLPGGGNSNAASLAAGNYTVIVGSGACTITKTITITQPAAFNISISPSATLCQGATTVFTASGANTYTWNTGGTGPNIITNVPGIYTVTGANVNNCATTATVGLTLDPLPIISVSGNTLICAAGQSITLTANGANSYTWQPGNINNAVAVLSPQVNTTYSVTGINSFGCSNTTTVDVVLNNITLTPGPQLLICSGQTATLTANGTTNYTWMPGNFNGQNYPVSPSTSQNYTVVGSVGACTFIATQDVSVTPLPTVSINMSPTQAICVGDPVTLSATGASSYLWQPGNLNGSSVTVTLTSNQIYTVTGTVGNCINQSTQQVITLPPINLAVTSATVCKGNIATLTTNGSSSYTYIWEPGGGSGNTFTVQPNQSTTYVVIASAGTCSSSATANVIVYDVIADFADNSINGNYYDMVEFTNLSVNNVKNYWFFTNQTTSTEMNPKVQFDDPGTYVACLLTENMQGCLDTLCKVINVGCPEDAVFIPNTFTPNEDGLNDVFRVSTLGQCIDAFEMNIFDRWGKVIFNSKDLAKGWDGKIKGILAKDDVYVYLVKYTMINKKSYSKTGHVTLMK